VDPAILLIIVFVVAPLIERMLKAGKPKDPQERPPRQRPGFPPQPQQRFPPQPPQREPQQTQREQVVLRPPAEQEGEAAAAMLPDDLWEILTGERRAPRLPEPREEYDPAGEDEAESLETATPDSWIEAQSSHTADSVPVLWERPEVQRAAPEVVSLEKLEIDDRKRHVQFHRRLDEMSAPERVRRPAANIYSITSEEDLRRAIILAEILGPPKGLE
jgi:hypothetical protein